MKLNLGTYPGFSKEFESDKKLSHFSAKTYVAGTQKNRLNETYETYA